MSWGKKLRDFLGVTKDSYFFRTSNPSLWAQKGAIKFAKWKKKKGREIEEERERGKIRRPLSLSLSLGLVLSLSQTWDRLYFPSSAFRRGCILIYFGNEGVTTRRTQGWGLPFYWNILQSHFAFFLLYSSTAPVIELCSFHV